MKWPASGFSAATRLALQSHVGQAQVPRLEQACSRLVQQALEAATGGNSKSDRAAMVRAASKIAKHATALLEELTALRQSNHWQYLLAFSYVNAKSRVNRQGAGVSDDELVQIVGDLIGPRMHVGRGAFLDDTATRLQSMADIAQYLQEKGTPDGRLAPYATAHFGREMRRYLREVGVSDSRSDGSKMVHIFELLLPELGIDREAQSFLDTVRSYPWRLYEDLSLDEVFGFLPDENAEGH